MFSNSPSIIGNYPEAFNAARNYPDGRLQAFQRHRMRLWTVYNVGMGSAGDVSFSGLWRVDSGLAYSLAARNQALSATQVALMTAAGYPEAANLAALGPITGNHVFFDDRGSETFKGYGLLDTSINYNIPVFRTLRPWVKFDVYNLFDNRKLIAWSTTIRQDPATPRDELGLEDRLRPDDAGDVRHGDGQHGQQPVFERDQHVSAGVFAGTRGRPHVPRGARLPLLVQASGFFSRLQALQSLEPERTLGFGFAGPWEVLPEGRTLRQLRLSSPYNHCRDDFPPERHETEARQPPPPPAPDPARAGVWLRAALIVLAGALAYANALSGPFVLDDQDTIVVNEQIRQLWPPSVVLFPALELPVAGRPVGQRLVRAELRARRPRCPRLPHRQHRDSHRLRAAAVRHRAPDSQSAVASRSVRKPIDRPRVRRRADLARPSAADRCGRLRHTANRADARLFLPADASTRASGGPAESRTRQYDQSAKGRWLVVAVVVACVLGMASKESMVTAPLMIVVYDRIFVFSTWKETWRRRVAVLRAARGDVGGARGADMVGPAVQVRRILVRRESVDLSAQSGADDRALPASDDLAARAGRRLRRAARADAD